MRLAHIQVVHGLSRSVLITLFGFIGKTYAASTALFFFFFYEFHADREACATSGAFFFFSRGYNHHVTSLTHHRACWRGLVGGIVHCCPIVGDGTAHDIDEIIDTARNRLLFSALQSIIHSILWVEYFFTVKWRDEEKETSGINK